MDLAQLGFATVFLAGIVSFLSPCVLPMVPGYISYVAGQSYEDMVRPVGFKRLPPALLPALGFVLGFSLIFIGLGASASALGQLLASFRAEADIIAGSLIIVFGLHMAGLLNIRFMNRELRFETTVRPAFPGAPVVLGMAFAFGWTPCIGPILGAILTVSASELTVNDGIRLLAIYSAGLAVPFLLVASFTGQIVRQLNRLRRVGAILHRLAGGLLVLVGVAMATGYLTTFGTWMLENVEFFQTLQY